MRFSLLISQPKKKIGLRTWFKYSQNEIFQRDLFVNDVTIALSQSKINPH